MADPKAARSRPYQATTIDLDATRASIHARAATSAIRTGIAPQAVQRHLAALDRGESPASLARPLVYRKR